ncbi:hypothetical protein DY000_02002367 [Brassica cretica]|uniref:Uncharacterized protein n=1 Tax=Brassica cretica TaxID=69181 RepID=A0ABQ7CEK6_BRACR|nr:hypothetical protein DY000_02002367 [Brassica cretica]
MNNNLHQLLLNVIGVKVSALELDPIKDVFWVSMEREREAIEGKVDPGNPYVLVASSSALRSLELLSYLCFKKRVNIGSSTPSRIKKLIDIAMH